ncbi:MAG: DUF167 domain-containing protein, partial [Patescibacteria group bacterium]|nr:DUF167 domain-containing protein [Patescibacteria group bacterium]
MKFFIKVKPNAHKPSVVKISETNFKISVSEPPEKGKANAATIRALAEYLKIAPARISVVAGSTS